MELQDAPVAGQNNFRPLLKGKITRLCPSGTKLYFHTSDDEAPYELIESDFNFIEISNPSFQVTYDLLKEAARNKWTVNVKRSENFDKHIRINDRWTHYCVDFVYVDF